MSPHSRVLTALARARESTDHFHDDISRHTTPMTSLDANELCALVTSSRRASSLRFASASASALVSSLDVFHDVMLRFDVNASDSSFALSIVSETQKMLDVMRAIERRGRAAKASECERVVERVARNVLHFASLTSERVVVEMLAEIGWPPSLRPSERERFSWPRDRGEGDDDDDDDAVNDDDVNDDDDGQMEGRNADFNAIDAMTKALDDISLALGEDEENCGGCQYASDARARAYANGATKAMFDAFTSRAKDERRANERFEKTTNDDDERRTTGEEVTTTREKEIPTKDQDCRRLERMFACVEAFAEWTPARVRVELERVVFADDRAKAIDVARNYLSLVVHAVKEIVSTESCAACAASDDPWWLFIADACKKFDDVVARNMYATRSTPRALDGLLTDARHAEAWLDMEREDVLSRARCVWSDDERWTRRNAPGAGAGDARRDDDDEEYKAPNVAEIVVDELKTALEFSRALSSVGWRLHFIKRVAAPLVEEFQTRCERRAVGTRGLGSLVASQGSWRAGSNGTHVIASTINACAFVARALREFADESAAMECGADDVFASRERELEKFASRWTEAIADAACAQFADKMIDGDFIAAAHLERYDVDIDDDDDDDDDGAPRNVAPSGFVLAALGPLRDRVEDARRALNVQAFNACWRLMATKTAAIVVRNVIQVARFTSSGARQMRRDADALVDVFAPFASRIGVVRAKTRALEDACALLQSSVDIAREFVRKQSTSATTDERFIRDARSRFRVSDALDFRDLVRVLARRRDIDVVT